jgi:hypothetical protein
MGKKRNQRMNVAIRADVARVLAEREGLAEPGALLPTRGQVLAKRAELEAAGKPSGVRPLAVALHVSPTTIQRRLSGK